MTAFPVRILQMSFYTSLAQLVNAVCKPCCCLNFSSRSPLCFYIPGAATGCHICSPDDLVLFELKVILIVVCSLLRQHHIIQRHACTGNGALGQIPLWRGHTLHANILPDIPQLGRFQRAGLSSGSQQKARGFSSILGFIVMIFRLFAHADVALWLSTAVHSAFPPSGVQLCDLLQVAEEIPLERRCLKNRLINCSSASRSPLRLLLFTSIYVYRTHSAFDVNI